MVKKRIVLKFPTKLVDQPVIYKLIKDYDLVFNILHAKITPNEHGLLVLELSGTKENFAAGLAYLKNIGVEIQALSKDIVRDEKKCTHCGICVVVCPTLALSQDKDTKKIIFEASKCIACELCVKTCPPRAMLVSYE